MLCDVSGHDIKCRVVLFSVYCDSGYEYLDEQCSPCGIGQYKNVRGRDVKCKTCPVNSTTSNVASTSENQCNIGKHSYAHCYVLT